MAGRTRRPALLGVYPRLEVLPALLRDANFPLRDLAGVLAKHVQEHDEIPRAPVEDAVELRVVVAVELAQLASDL